MKNLIYLVMIIALTGAAYGQKTVTTTSLLVELERASEGLVLTSETDADVHNYVSPAMGQVLTVEEFRTANFLTSDTVIEQVDATDWFKLRTNDAGDWQNMQYLLNSKFKSITVFKVGTIQVQYYVVGVFNNRLVGIRTYAIQT